MVPKLIPAPKNAHIKKTLEGENLSAIERIAKSSVPMINPNCTAEVKCSRAFSFNLKFMSNSLKIAFVANHREVQQNWANTIMKIVNLIFFIIRIG